MADKYSVGRFTFTFNLRSSYEPTRLFGFDGRRCGAQSKAQSKPTAFGEKNGILMIHSDYPNRLFSYVPSSGYRGELARSISLFSLPVRSSLSPLSIPVHQQPMGVGSLCKLCTGWIHAGWFYCVYSSTVSPRIGALPRISERASYRPNFKINKRPTD